MKDQDIDKFSTWLFSGDCKFIAGATKPSAIPDLNLSEVAFVGKSNVGKSSLINSLTNRTKLVRVSHTPGATKQINFFLLRDHLILVDLPGYGYAKASKVTMYEWSKLITYYLKNRINLKKVCLLIDARRGIKENDTILMEMLDEMGLTYQIILTKTDKLSKIEVENVNTSIQEVMNKHTALHPVIIATSSRSSFGMSELRKQIAELV